MIASCGKCNKIERICNIRESVFWAYYVYLQGNNSGKDSSFTNKTYPMGILTIKQ
jgi:hypothetical protein